MCVCARTRGRGAGDVEGGGDEGAPGPPARTRLPPLSARELIFSSLKPVIFCPLPASPHAAPASCLSPSPLPPSSPGSPALPVALEGRGRCLCGGGACVGVIAYLPCWGLAGGCGEGAASPVPLSPQAQRHISDLYEDLRDGHNLISLLEVLSGDSLVRAPAHLPPLEPRLPFTQIPLPAFLPWGLSHVPSPCPARPRPLLCLPAWERPRSLCRGFTAPLVSVSEPRPITSRSALLRFLCCLDCELWPLPFTLCPALAGQPRERDVIRSSRLVSGRACWLRQRVGSPRLGAQLTWGWWPVWPDLCLALGGADGCASSCLASCLLHCPGPGLGPTVGGGLPPWPGPGGRLPVCHCPPPSASWLLSPPTPSFLPTAWPWPPFSSWGGRAGTWEGLLPHWGRPRCSYHGRLGVPWADGGRGGLCGR